MHKFTLRVDFPHPNKRVIFGNSLFAWLDRSPSPPILPPQRKEIASSNAKRSNKNEKKTSLHNKSIEGRNIKHGVDTTKSSDKSPHLRSSPEPLRRTSFKPRTPVVDVQRQPLRQEVSRSKNSSDSRLVSNKGRSQDTNGSFYVHEVQSPAKVHPIRPLSATIEESDIFARTDSMQTFESEVRLHNSYTWGVWRSHVCGNWC